MPRARSGVTVGEWAKLARAVQELDVKERPHFRKHFQKLADFVEGVRALEVERDFHAARKQEATRKIRAMLEEGNRVATVVRLILKNEYGPTSERLTEFGIPPFRGRKRRRKEGDGETPEPAAKAPKPETP